VVGPTTGFVARSGTQLLVSGQPWKFAGYNLPCAQPFTLAAGQFDYYLDNIALNSGANAIRVWFFQSNGGPGNWTPFDQVISSLKARGMRAIVTLGNGAGTCDSLTGNQAAKPLSWYQTGYTQPTDGYKLSFQSFAQQVAAHYASEPTVAFWQLLNEASAPSLNTSGTYYCDNTAAMNALRTFSDAMAGTLHQADHNHLVNLGTQGSGQCGLDGTGFKYVHAGALDLCEYHDYGFASQALPSNGNDLLKEQIDGCHSLGKPIFVGESGIQSNVQPDGSQPPCNTSVFPPDCTANPITPQTIQQRATFFQAKILAGNTAGLVGYLVWFKSPYYAPSTDLLAIGDGDPTENVVRLALMTGPTTGIPEAPWPALLGVSAGLLVFGVVVISTRRSKRRLAPAS
jgi:hypothetical protein